MSDQHGVDVVAQNKAYWEMLAPHRVGEPVEFFRSGGSALSKAELRVVGDVRGRRVLQLAGSVGDEGISLAQLGAQVTVVDLAAAHLATGRAKAAALGLKVSYVEQDMMSLGPDLVGFDIVYISTGGICWAPSITDWARLVAERLNASGLLVISEHHPLWEVLSVRGDGAVAVTGDYFHAVRDGYEDPAKAPQVTRDVGTPAIPHRSYVWSISSVVGAVLAAGLTLRSLEEFAEPDMYPGLDAAGRLPATYLLTAFKQR